MVHSERPQGLSKFAAPMAFTSRAIFEIGFAGLRCSRIKFSILELIFWTIKLRKKAINCKYLQNGSISKHEIWIEDWNH